MPSGPLPPSVSRARWVWTALNPTFRFWMETEVHVYAFSIAANVLLAFYPFLIVCISLGTAVFGLHPTQRALELALSDVFPRNLTGFLITFDPASLFDSSKPPTFLRYNLPYPRQIDLLAIAILLFSANGIFEPLEVSLNRIWGIPKNRSFFRNQAISFLLIFGCGTLALLSLALAALGGEAAFRIQRWVSVIFFKSIAAPLTVLALYLVYRYLPNGRPPARRVLPAAIGVAIALEALKSINTLVWPLFALKLEAEYNVFQYSANLIFFSFLASMLVLAGAEWAARGHKLDHVQKAQPGNVP